MDRLTILAWNINGIRAQRGTTLKQTLDSLQADIICLQETKVTRDQIDEQTAVVDGYSSYFSYSKARSGYSGVATYVKDGMTPDRAESGLSGRLTDCSQSDQVIGCYGDQLELFTEEELLSLDNEGRCIITEHSIRVCDETRSLVVINVYCPRADPDKPDRLTYKLRFYDLLQVRVQELINNGRHVVVLGDMNTAHKKIDHCDPDEDEEFSANRGRQWMDRVIIELDLSLLKASPQKACPKSSSPSLALTHNDEESDSREAPSLSIPSQSTCTPPLRETMDSSPETPCSPMTPPTELSSSVTGHGLLVDTFRALHPMRTGAYTNWCTVTGARATNYGRRLDYILADPRLVMVSLNKAEIKPEFQGSDHCPVVASFLCTSIPAKKCPSLCTKYLPEFSGRQQKLSSFMRVLKRFDNSDVAQGVFIGSANGSSDTEAVREDKIGKTVELVPDKSHFVLKGACNIGKLSSKTLGKRSATDSSKVGKKLKSDVAEKPQQQQGSLLNFFAKKSSTTVADKQFVHSNGSSAGIKNVCDGSSELPVDPCSNMNNNVKRSDNKSENNNDNSCDNVLGDKCDSAFTTSQHTTYRHDNTCDSECDSSCDVIATRSTALACANTSVRDSIKSLDECDSSNTGPVSSPAVSTVDSSTLGNVPGSCEVISNEQISGRKVSLVSGTSGDCSVVSNSSQIANTTIKRALPCISPSKGAAKKSISSDIFSDSKSVQVPSSSANSSGTKSNVQKSLTGCSGVGTSDNSIPVARSWKDMLKGPPQAPLCKGHKEPCVLREVKKDGPNKGKKFWVCCKPQGHKSDPAARCDHFVWISK